MKILHEILPHLKPSDTDTHTHVSPIHLDLSYIYIGLFIYLYIHAYIGPTHTSKCQVIMLVTEIELCIHSTYTHE